MDNNKCFVAKTAFHGVRAIYSGKALCRARQLESDSLYLCAQGLTLDHLDSKTVRG